MLHYKKLFGAGAIAAAAILPLAMAEPAHAQSVTEQRDWRTNDRDWPSSTSRVWVGGHFENRQQTRRVPGETRQEWVPPRYETVFVPAVTERIRVPAVTERVRCAPLIERVWVPPVTDRVWQHGYWDLRGWRPAQYETRVVRPGHYEERSIPRDCWEDRVVRPERWDTRIVVPERREWRLVEQGRYVTVTVRREGWEVTTERVWVPGHWE